MCMYSIIAKKKLMCGFYNKYQAEFRSSVILTFQTHKLVSPFHSVL